MLWVELRCPGPEGLTNGCPEGFSEHGFFRSIPDSHDALKEAYSELLKEAEDRGWQRNTRDLKFRCPSCSGACDHPAEIAGIAWAKWDEALRLYEAGKMPSEWGGKNGLPSAKQFNNAVRRYAALLERVKASPAYKPKPEERASRLDEARWSEVLSRFEGGEEKDAICIGTGGWPTDKQWNGRTERNAEFRQRVNAVHEKRRSKVNWEEALRRFLAGDRLAQILDQPGMPSRNQWGRRLSTDKGFRKTVYDHYFWVGHGKATEQMGDAPFERVLQLIREGMWLKEACSQPGTVSQQTFSKKVGRQPEFGREYEAAITVSGRKRFLVVRPVGERPYRSEMQADWVGAVEALREGKAVSDVVGWGISIDGYPTSKQWYARLKRDPEFADIVARAASTGRKLRLDREDMRPCTLEKIDEIIAYIREGASSREATVRAGVQYDLFKRRARLDLTVRPRVKDALAQYQARRVRERKAESHARADQRRWDRDDAARKKRDDAVPLGERFKRRLMQNEVVAAVSAALPKSLLPHIRDDVMSDMVLAILDGSLPIEKVSESAKAYVTKYHRENRTYADISLDMTVGEGKETLGGLIKSDEGLWAENRRY